MKNLKKYKNGIIYNIITVNGSQPRPTRRQKTSQPQQNKYNPQIRGIQYLAPPPPSYADYGMSRFNTGNAYNNNVQDQYLREKVQALENKFNESNNLPMIEDLQSQINNLGDQQDNLAEQQFQQRQNLINAGSYMLDFQNHINDRFDRIKVPYSFEDSAGSFAETGDDSSFVAQIGNDRQDLLDYQNEEEDDESPSPMLTPQIRVKTRNFTKPRNYEQLQISNEPFFQQRNEDEFFESPLQTEEKQESKQDEMIEHEAQQPPPPPQEIQKPKPTKEQKDKWVSYFRTETAIEKFKERFPEFIFGEEDPEEYLRKEEESKKKLTTQDIQIRPSEVEAKKEPIVEDVEDDEEEDIKPVKEKAKKLNEAEQELIRLKKQYQELGGTTLSVLQSKDIRTIKNSISALNMHIERKKLKKQYEDFGGTDENIKKAKSNEQIKKAVDFQIKRLKNITDQYRMLDGYDEKILNSTNYDLIKGAYDELLKQQPKESPVKKGSWGGSRLGTYRDWETDRKSTRLNSSH